MADVIHRTTLQFISSANTPDFPEPTWKHRPDMAAVVGVPAKYWKAPLDWDAPSAGPVPMTAPEQAAKDAAMLAAEKDGATAPLDAPATVDLLRALALVVLDEINILRTHTAIGLSSRTIAQLKTALQNKMS